MAKFHGIIGFATQRLESEDSGVYVEDIEERHYSGDLLRHFWSNATADHVNPDVNVSNEISVVVDPYLIDHIHLMRYVEFRGAKWCVSDVDVAPPRLNITIGGVYNG